VRRGREGEENGGSEERWRWSASGPTWRRHGVTEDLARCGRGGFLALFACAFRVSPAGAESGAASASEAEAAPAAVRMQRVECGGSSYSTLDEWISGNSLSPPPSSDVGPTRSLFPHRRKGLRWRWGLVWVVGGYDGRAPLALASPHSADCAESAHVVLASLFLLLCTGIPWG
jgi:hypothetical protein